MFFHTGWYRRTLFLVSRKHFPSFIQAYNTNRHHMYHTKAKVKHKNCPWHLLIEFFRLLNPLGTPILPFSTNLWLAVAFSYLLSIISYKILSFVQAKLRNEKSTENLSEISLNMLGIYVLQAVKIKLVVSLKAIIDGSILMI